MKFGIKEYSYKTCIVYYLTLNGRQIGSVHFSKKKALETIRKIKNGEEWR